uniref:Uncharacterized protein n=1 Tax=Junco hyemalis TaxID=40217 RepID=A0A8C5INW2_JUNHY
MSLPQENKSLKSAAAEKDSDKYFNPKNQRNCTPGFEAPSVPVLLMRNKGPPKTRAVSAVALQDHIIHNHQLNSLRDSKYWTKKKEHKSKEDAEKENLLDPSAPQLTLVEHPSLSFPAEEWVKRKSSTQHGKSIQCCPIFRKEFAIRPRVESCPMCRKEQDQTRVIHDGASSWRGYIIGKESKDLREAVPPKDRKLRKQLFEKMLCYICFLAGFLSQEMHGEKGSLCLVMIQMPKCPLKLLHTFMGRHTHKTKTCVKPCRAFRHRGTLGGSGRSELGLHSR